MPRYAYVLNLYNYIGENPTSVKFICKEQEVHPEETIELVPNGNETMFVKSPKDEITLTVQPVDNDIGGDRKVLFDHPRPSRPIHCIPRRRPNINQWIVTIKHSHNEIKGISYEPQQSPFTIQIEKWDVTFKYREDEYILADPPPAQTPVTATDKQ